jgi:hypothetical protein
LPSYEIRISGDHNARPRPQTRAAWPELMAGGGGRSATMPEEIR